MAMPQSLAFSSDESDDVADCGIVGLALLDGKKPPFAANSLVLFLFLLSLIFLPLTMFFRLAKDSFPPATRRSPSLLEVGLARARRLFSISVLLG